MPDDARPISPDEIETDAPASRRDAAAPRPDRPSAREAKPRSATAVNRVFEDPTIAQFWSPWTLAGRAALDATITRQAQIIAYVDEFKLLIIVTLAAIPLLVIFTKPPEARREDHPMAIE